MSPASYLTAPPRVAGGQYTSVNALPWAALGLFVVALVGGTVFVAVRGWRAWQAFASFAAGSMAGAEILTIQVELLAAKADRTNARAAELDAAVASLERSLRRARILADAVRGMRAALRFLPLKG